MYAEHSDTVHLLGSLGFTVHDKMSVFIQTQEIVFVGFVLNSVSMMLRLPDGKKENLLKLFRNALRRSRMPIREFSKLNGKLVATKSGAEYAQLRYKPLAKIKYKQSKLNGGNFEATMYLPTKCRRHIQWRLDNLQVSFKLISHGKRDSFLQIVQKLVGMIKLSILGQGELVS